MIFWRWTLLLTVGKFHLGLVWGGAKSCSGDSRLPAE